VKRHELEHLIRAAGEIADDDLVVIGSQAILASHPDAPPSLLVSLEADIYPRRDPAVARAVDAAIGDGSSFHETYGLRPTRTAWAPKPRRRRLAGRTG